MIQKVSTPRLTIYVYGAGEPSDTNLKILPACSFTQLRASSMQVTWLEEGYAILSFMHVQQSISSIKSINPPCGEEKTMRNLLSISNEGRLRIIYGQALATSIVA